mmetsp:Transcript_30099/g.82234  ORF Transcript_30099/g.82234 Transcript_30099/m.82234 type:complete len:246 (+) Transcript_30099:686-1423(+)
MKSVETTSSSVYPMIPFIGPSAASRTAALISSYVAGVFSLHVRSTTDTSGVGTRNAMPVSFPFSIGITLPTAFAAPVDDGMMFCPAPRPPRQSLPDGPSTVFWVAVVACTVVISPSTIPNLSLITFANGARQLVVHDALETIGAPAYCVLLTPITYIGASADGAEMNTTLAPPPSLCTLAFSMVVKIPVASTTAVAPLAAHGISLGSRHAVTVMGLPSMISLPSLCLTVPLYCPWTESYLNMYTM